MAATVWPPFFNSGISRAIKRVLPLPEVPTKEMALIDFGQKKGLLFLRQEGIPVVGRLVQVLLDRPGARPAQQVEIRAGLVVRSGSAGSAEGLLAYDRTGRLVVNIEVPGGMTQDVESLDDGLSLG